MIRRAEFARHPHHPADLPGSGRATRPVFGELVIDAQLLKPVQQDELLETIYRKMSRSQGNAPPLARPTPASKPPQASPARPHCASSWPKIMSSGRISPAEQSLIR